MVVTFYRQTGFLCCVKAYTPRPERCCRGINTYCFLWSNTAYNVNNTRNEGTIIPQELSFQWAIAEDCIIIHQWFVAKGANEEIKLNTTNKIYSREERWLELVGFLHTPYPFRLDSFSRKQSAVLYVGSTENHSWICFKYMTQNGSYTGYMGYTGFDWHFLRDNR